MNINILNLCLELARKYPPFFWSLRPAVFQMLRSDNRAAANEGKPDLAVTPFQIFQFADHFNESSVAAYKVPLLS